MATSEWTIRPVKKIATQEGWEILCCVCDPEGCVVDECVRVNISIKDDIVATKAALAKALSLFRSDYELTDQLIGKTLKESELK